MFFLQAKFREGLNINRIDGLKDMIFSESTHAESGTFAEESLRTMIPVLGLCDTFYYGKINDRDIFCIYYKGTMDEKMAREAIKEVAEDGKTDNIVNYEETLIDAAIKHINYSYNKDYEFYCDDSIFWDVINNMIIIADKDNYIKMAYALESESWRSFANITQVPAYEYVDDNSIQPFTKKAKSFITK